MKNTKKKTRKLLSIFLAVVMIMTSCSVCFSSFAADDALKAFADALKSETVKELSNYTVTENTSSGSGSNVQKTNKTTITLDTYEKYSEVVSLIEKLDAAIKESPSYVSKATFPGDGSSQNCVNAGEVKDEILSRLTDLGFMTTAELSEYNVSTLLSNVMSNTGVITHSGNQGSTSKVPARVFDVTVVTTNDYKGYLAQKNSLSEVEDTISLGITYTITMSRESYKTGVWNYHYHSVLNVDSYPITLVYDTNNNTEVKQKLNEYNAYLDSVDMSISYEDMLDMVLDGTMESFYNAFKEKYDQIVDYVGGESVYDKLFDRASQVRDFMASCVSAMDVQTYLAIAEQWKAFVEDNPDYGIYDYGAYDYDAMNEAYNEFVQIYNNLADGGSELLAYLEKHGEISLDYYNNFTDNIKVYALDSLEDEATALYDSVKDTYKDLSTEEQQAVYSRLVGYIDSIKTYSDQVIDTIYPDGYDYLVSLKEELFCETNEYVIYFTEKTTASYVDVSTEDIEAIIAELPEKLSGLNSFADELKASVGEERANELVGALCEKADGLETELYKLLAQRFEAEVAYADSIYKALGSPTELNIDSFIKLKTAFVGLEDEILTYLEENGVSDYINEETMAVYNALKASVYDEYIAFASTFGFSKYEKSEIEYASREVYPNDQVKTEAYDVTAENLENTVEKLDSFLTSETFTELIGGKDIKTALSEAVENAVYSDSLINTVVQLLYPLVLGEFEKVWETLPLTVQYSGMDVKVNYKKTLQNILDEGNLRIYPTSLAEILPDEYADAKQMLLDARTWESTSVYDRDTGLLKLTWGVDEAENKEEAFYDAFSAAMSGLKPLIMALLCDQQWLPAKSEDIATGSVSIIITITLNVALQLSASANNGYANALAPVYEALGCENIPTADEVRNYTELEQVARAIFEPIFSLIDKIGENPVDTIISILPNVLYALSFDMITPILSMLKTTIAYEASANLVGTVMSDGVDIDVGEMLDLKSLGLDLSKGLEGILELIGIEIPEIDVATLATAGTLSSRDTARLDYIYDNSSLASGKAYTIEADKADIAYYLLTYVVDLISDKDALNALLSKFLDEDQIASVTSILDALSLKSTGDVVAAAIELLNTEKYPQSTFVYPEYVESEKEEPVDTSQMTEEELKEYEAQGKAVIYSDYWTKEKAQYVADNLIPFVEKLAGILGYDISNEIENLLSNLYTKENLDKLVELVQNLLGSLTENEDIASVIDVVSPLLNIDIKSILSALMSYSAPSIKDGDRDAFTNALVDFITPAVPVLKLLLVDSAQGSSLVIADLVEAYGYNGYDNAVIPVLEALGCNSADITPYDTFVTLSDREMVEAVLSPVLNLVDSVSDDPINKIVDLLPNILYFISYGGLEQAIDNLLEPVYVVLDVIRPIADVNLTVNLGIEELLADLLAQACDGAGIKIPGYSELSSAVMALGTMQQYTSANGSQAVKLVVEDSLTAEFVTVILRMVVKTVCFSDNVETIVEQIRNSGKVSEEDIQDIEKVLNSLRDISTDQVLFVLFYAFFGVNTGVTAFDNVTNLVSDKIKKAFDNINGMDEKSFKEFVDSTADLLLKLTEALGGNDPESPNAVASFFAKIIALFQKIWDWFAKVFMKVSI
ncbi:MAG: hypothetical protein ACI4W6_10320 [Acutalibacteraceae bacterium]